MRPILSNRLRTDSTQIRSLFLAVTGWVFFGFSSICGALTVNNANFEIGAVNNLGGAAGFWFVDEPPTGLGLNAGFGATGWQISVPGSIRGADAFSQDFPTFVPHSGHISVMFTSPPPQGLTSLSQVISTAPGGQYALHFFLANPDPDGIDNRFSVTWGGVEVRPSNAPPIGTNWVLAGGAAWTEYVIPITASAASTNLVFSGFSNSSLLLDDVSIVNIPEPGAASAFVIGTLALASRRRRLRADRRSN